MTSRVATTVLSSWLLRLPQQHRPLPIGLRYHLFQELKLCLLTSEIVLTALLANREAACCIILVVSVCLYVCQKITFESLDV